MHVHTGSPTVNKQQGQNILGEHKASSWCKPKHLPLRSCQKLMCEVISRQLRVRVRRGARASEASECDPVTRMRKADPATTPTSDSRLACFDLVSSGWIRGGIYTRLEWCELLVIKVHRPSRTSGRNCAAANTAHDCMPSTR